jgi:hypothetical protein
MTAEEIIKLLRLRPLPFEGGFYRETHRSPDQVSGRTSAGRFPGDRSWSTAIYYLLTPETFSALHRLPGDEVYHFYLGDPVTMLQLHPAGTGEIVTLGPVLDQGQQVQVVVTGGTWQGSVLNPGGRFALLGTTMAPGFDPADNEPAERELLIARYPAYRNWIIRLARAA